MQEPFSTKNRLPLIMDIDFQYDTENENEIVIHE